MEHRYESFYQAWYEKTKLLFNPVDQAKFNSISRMAFEAACIMLDNELDVGIWQNNDAREEPLGLSRDTYCYAKLRNGELSRFPRRIRDWEWHVTGSRGDIMAYKVVNFHIPEHLLG